MCWITVLIRERCEEETNSSHYLRKGMDWKENCYVAANTVPHLPHCHHKQGKFSQFKQAVTCTLLSSAHFPFKLQHWRKDLKYRIDSPWHRCGFELIIGFTVTEADWILFKYYGKVDIDLV